MCQATGWEWEYVEDHLTAPRLKALNRFWAHSPPPHVLLNLMAQALGIRPGRVTERAIGDVPREGWTRLRELGADSASGIAISGKPPF